MKMKDTDVLTLGQACKRLVARVPDVIIEHKDEKLPSLRILVMLQVCHAATEAILQGALKAWDIPRHDPKQCGGIITSAVKVRWGDFIKWATKSGHAEPDHAATARRAKSEQKQVQHKKLVSAWVKDMREKPKSFRTQAAKNVAERYNKDVPQKHWVNYQVVILAVKNAGKWDRNSTE